MSTKAPQAPRTVVEPGTVWILGPLRSPVPFMSMNDRGDRRAEAPMVREWRSAACAAARQQHLPRQLGNRVRVDVAVHFPDVDARGRPNGQDRDRHNYYPTAKHLLDGLTPPKPLTQVIDLPGGGKRKVPAGQTVGYPLLIDDADWYVDGPVVVIRELVPRVQYPFGAVTITITALEVLR
ncbi:MAG: hypothetical protein EPO06_11880 [Burkholderiaceae bacterium]|nr:MAG: hypothetical protein EPO06_11880 [Burkholderiaceae bacterium]